MKRYKEQIKRLVVIFIMITMALSVANVSFAATNEVQAKILNKLGLFQGISQTEFVPALDQSLNREEAMKMILTVLGKSKEAESTNLSCPFNDVSDWAKPYVAYAASKNITKGISDDIFGAWQGVTARQLYTFYLRALGYEESGTNIFDTATETALDIGLIKPDEASENADRVLKRDDLVGISYNALYVKRKGTDNSLLSELADAKLLNRDIVASTGDDGLLASIAVQNVTSTAQPMTTEQPEKTTSSVDSAFIEFKATPVVNHLTHHNVVANGIGWYGYTEQTTKEGVECRKIPVVDGKDRRLVLKMDDSYMSPTDGNCTINITYFDEGTDQIRAAYSTDTAKYKSITINKTDSKTWKTQSFKVKDASFAHQQDEKVDFTIWAEPEGGKGTDEYISKIEIVNESSKTSAQPTGTTQPETTAQPTATAQPAATTGTTTSADSAFIEFKATPVANHLTHHNVAANGIGWYGYTEQTTKEGVECRKIPVVDGKDKRLVLKMDDSYMSPTDSNCTINITYFDEGTDQIRAAYSTDTAKYKSITINKTDSKTWKTQSFKVKDASFAHQQDEKVDFTIWAEPEGGKGTDEYISKIEIIKG